MASDLLVGLPTTDTSAEASLRKMRLPAIAAAPVTILLLGDTSARTTHNWVAGGADALISGTPVYGSGYVRLNGSDSAQSRIDTGQKQTPGSCTFYAAFKPVAAVIDPNHQPVAFSTNQGAAATPDSARNSTGITLCATDVGTMSFYGATYNQATDTNDNRIATLTGQDFTRWNMYCARIGGGLVQLDNLTTGAHAESAIQPGFAVDYNVNRIFWGDNVSTSPLRDGLADHGVAAIFRALHGSDAIAAMYAIFKERMRVCSPSIAI
jgi:hypothetical protein